VNEPLETQERKLIINRRIERAIILGFESEMRPAHKVRSFSVNQEKQLLDLDRRESRVLTRSGERGESDLPLVERHSRDSPNGSGGLR